MRMFTIPNQSSGAKVFQEFDANGRMKPSAYYDRIVDVMEELVRITVLMRPHVAQLTSRYSERKEAAKLEARIRIRCHLTARRNGSARAEGLHFLRIARLSKSRCCAASSSVCCERLSRKWA